MPLSRFPTSPPLPSSTCSTGAAVLEAIADEDESGDFLNYEVSFSYSSRPGSDGKTKSKNIHLLIQFFLGVFDMVRIPINI
ncbi:hypothetical protein V8E36_008365 [Tilletia maclaganii]